MYEEFSREEINYAEKTIYEHIYRDYNIKGRLGSGQDSDELPKDLRGTVFYQAIFKTGFWNECNLTDASGNGTIFLGNDFYKALLNNASFQYCDFSHNIFENCSLQGSNFSNSTFLYTAIQDSKIYSCSFVGVEFYSGIIRNTDISSSNFELCCFRKTLLENLDLRQLTLNYVLFDDVKMKEVCLPFLQLPYTFNGLQYVFETDDNITISSHNPLKKNIDLSEYKDLIHEFTVFFSSKNEYFPLTNCYLVQDKKNSAITCNETGVMSSAEKHDFRSLYFYCIQAAQILNLSREKRGLLYSQINKVLSDTYLAGGEYHQFYLYFPKIKRLLFDTPNNHPIMTLTIHTNIDPNDYSKLSLLLCVLDTATKECGVNLDSTHIEIRHNSPNIVDFFASGILPDLVANFQQIYGTLEPIIASIANVITVGTTLSSVGKYTYNKLARHSTRKKLSVPCTTKERTISSIAKLRRELNKIYINSREAKELSPLFKTNIKKQLSEKLIKLSNDLKNSGIIITSIEIQFLDGKDDILDNLYYQKNIHLI